MLPEQFQPEVSSLTVAGAPQQARKRKRGILLAIILSLFVIAGGVAAYIWFVYIPNKPEVVLQKAVESFINDKASYTIDGKLDQAGPNDPDFTYQVKSDKDGGAETKLQMSTFLQSPRLGIVNAHGALALNLSGVEDFKTMATHYTNAGKPGIQEAIAFFGESSGVTSYQDKWIQVDRFITEQPFAAKPSTTRVKGIPGAELSAIGPVESVNGIQARKYDVTLDQQAFKLFLGRIDQIAGVPLLSGMTSNLAQEGGVVRLSVWIDLKTKTVEQLTYAGRPFKTASVSIKLTAAQNGVVTIPGAQDLTDVLSYGIVNKVLFNHALQQGGDSDSDRERIADLKGIKTALEIYKNKNGQYPERYEMSVNQEGFIGTKMPGADLDVFRDPAGSLIGRNGSQYAYVPAQKSDDQNCGKFSKPCEKFFISTSLSNGQRYQLNSY